MLKITNRGGMKITGTAQEFLQLADTLGEGVIDRATKHHKPTGESHERERDDRIRARD